MKPWTGCKRHFQLKERPVPWGEAEAEKTDKHTRLQTGMPQTNLSLIETIFLPPPSNTV
jgi:hypothetical protein